MEQCAAIKTVAVDIDIVLGGFAWEILPRRIGYLIMTWSLKAYDEPYPSNRSKTL
jgi:hypothetical protein